MRKVAIIGSGQAGLLAAHGDGVTSLFTQVGVIDPQAGRVKLLGETWVDEAPE